MHGGVRTTSQQVGSLILTPVSEFSQTWHFLGKIIEKEGPLIPSDNLSGDLHRSGNISYTVLRCGLHTSPKAPLSDRRKQDVQ